MKRLLALALVVCMMFSGFAFAEGDAAKDS